MIKTLSVKVDMDDTLRAACEPFDFSFDGTSTFDLPHFDAPIRDGSWSIGLIVGPSGSGKTNLLKDAYGLPPELTWDPSKAVVSQMGSWEQAVSRLAATGLNSVPSWCRPYHVLSNGEQWRARLARAIESNASFDEYSSVVDRDVAKSASWALQRYIRKEKLTGVVFSSCHHDIIDWLQPDWIFETATASLTLGRSLQRHPSIELTIQASDRFMWPLFGRHHYMNAAINRSARCFVASLAGRPIAFASAISYPSGTVKNAWREHRTVVLPEFQGLGIGPRLSDWVAHSFVMRGCRYFSKTAHPSMGGHRSKSPNWKPTSKNRIVWVEKADLRRWTARDKACFSHEYVIPKEIS